MVKRKYNALLNDLVYTFEHANKNIVKNFWIELNWIEWIVDV